MREKDTTGSLIIDEFSPLFGIIRDFSQNTPTSAFALTNLTVNMEYYKKSIVRFNASNVVSTSSEVKPYTILAVPIYVY